MAIEDDNILSKRKLQIFLLLDTSYSMIGERIGKLNEAMERIIPELKREGFENDQADVFFRAIEFSSHAKWIIGPDTTLIQDLEEYWPPLVASGPTDFGSAIRLLSTELTTEKMGRYNYPPVLILLSDGAPTDQTWQNDLKTLNKMPWGQPGNTIRIAFDLEDECDHSVLEKFTGSPEYVISITKPEHLASFIKWATITVSKSVSQGMSADPQGGSLALPPPPNLDDFV